ncbi:Major facilitator superfamily domain-containing protein 10 [Penicillium subrubescens]|uniref:Major facilitator superfamily domain-containing protein 10 n=1 Tax=Penicillium subrubescens TaxID=1316194 RepID=A0A1Q5UCC6_9EURO|nr:Major facilitator superfamily domain-containing protein 10 [Penicillium subrubescens]
MGSTSMSVAVRKKILKTLFVSLLLDLISFTFILPLFPSVLSYYRAKDEAPNSLLNGIFHYLNAYKNSFSKPIDSRYDIILLGGAFGSLFSLLQALAAPFIGRLSDIYGRRQAMLLSMAGNILSVSLWVGATDFRTFLASRIVGGLTEGNVQLANAIVSDISDESQRGSAMALVGACFSIAFTCGPMLGAALSTIDMMASNKFAVAAGVSLLLVVAETLYIYVFLPETHLQLRNLPGASDDTAEKSNGQPKTNGVASMDGHSKPLMNGHTKNAKAKGETNNLTVLKITHFLFLISFSGLEFSLPFITAAFYGRRHENSISIRLECAGALLAATSATVVMNINSLGSLEAREAERGAVLGHLRSWGQVGRALGPMLFCSLFWWAGREVAYTTGGAMMVGVGVIVFGLLRSPVRTSSRA